MLDGNLMSAHQQQRPEFSNFAFPSPKESPVSATSPGLMSPPPKVHPETPIAEEDEANDSSSDPSEPQTPTSSHSHDVYDPNRPRLDGPDAYHQEMKPKPLEVAQRLPSREAPAPPARTAPQAPAASVPEKQLPSIPRALPTEPKDVPKPANKSALTSRVGTFVRSKLHRQPTNEKLEPSNDKAMSVSTSDAKSKAGSSTVSGSATPSKNRRFSSFSLSPRATPPTSESGSPPVPSSPTSTAASEQEHMSDQLDYSRRNSQSASGLNFLARPRSGITWGTNYTVKNGQLAPTKQSRRRSASTEMVPRIRKPNEHLDSDDEEIVTGLQATYSKPAQEGVGLKARRLSTSLPDDFLVDTCELDKEFKSSSLAPGKRGKLVGKGATATVCLMARKGAPSDELYAVKEFRTRQSSEDESDYVKKVKSEYSIAKSLHHPNIVETVRLCTHKNRWNHVMEYCAVGEIYSLVEKGHFKPNGYYKLEDRLCFFKQLLQGVYYLHTHGIAHRDIKLENLLMTSDGMIKISDFGVSEVFSGVHPGLRAAGGECGKNMGEIRRCPPGICGSLPYVAPEVLEKQGDYDPRPLDVWSCAIVFLTMKYGGQPWNSASPDQPHYARFKKGFDEWLPNHPDGKIADVPDGWPKCGPLFTNLETPALKRMMLKMLNPKPEYRITIEELMEIPTVKNIECCCPDSFEDPMCGIDASKCGIKKKDKVFVQKKHQHIPPKDSKTPRFMKHRFDMGDGWN